MQFIRISLFTLICILNYFNLASQVDYQPFKNIKLYEDYESSEKRSKSIKIKSLTTFDYYSIAKFYKETGKDSLASIYYLKGIEYLKVSFSSLCKKPTKKEWIFWIGYGYFELEDYKNSETWFNKAKTTNPENERIDYYLKLISLLKK